MKSRGADRNFSSKFGYLPSEIDARLRPLRANDLLPGGGASAPDLVSNQIALMILMMIPRRAVESYEVGLRAAKLRLLQPPGLKAALGWDSPEPLTFAGALVLLLECLDLEWRAVRVEDDGRRAFITITRDGRAFDLVFVEDLEATAATVGDDPARYEDQGAAYMGQAFFMGAGALKQIALTMLHSESGWAEDGAMHRRASAIREAAKLNVLEAVGKS